MNSIINKYDIIIILLFILIICVFGIHKYIHNEKCNLDKKVDDILNKKEINIKQQAKIEVPKNLFVEDYQISEILIKNDSILALENEVKNKL